MFLLVQVAHAKTEEISQTSFVLLCQWSQSISVHCNDCVWGWRTRNVDISRIAPQFTVREWLSRAGMATADWLRGAAPDTTELYPAQSRLSRVVCWQAGNAALRVDRPQLRLIPALLQFLEGLDFLPADGKKLSRRISACFVASSMISLLLILNTSHALHCAGLNRRQQGDKPILLVNSVIYGTSKVILKGSRIGGLQVGSLKVLPYLRLPLPADSWVNRKFANPAALSLHRFIINIVHISNAIISELAC